MIKIVRWAAGVVVGLGIVAATRVQGQEKNPTLVGIVRSDGVILPFAEFDGRQWRSFPSPGADSATHTPQTFDLPTRWSVHFANGSRRRTAVGGSSVEFITDSESSYDTWGQLTSLSPRAIGANEYLPRDRVGVAVSGDAFDVPVTTFVARDDQSTFWTVNRRKIETAFRQAADTLAPNVETVRLRQLHIARENVDGAQLFYVEAIGLRRSAGTQRDCAPAVYYQAWIRRPSGSSDLKVVDHAIEAGADCDSPGAEPTRHTPMGVIRLGGRRFIAVERTFYEGGNRQLFELTQTSLTPAHTVKYE
jgi:hypothetical protein